jgi:hypothetical protein
MKPRLFSLENFAAKFSWKPVKRIPSLVALFPSFFPKLEQLFVFQVAVVFSAVLFRSS